MIDKKVKIRIACYILTPVILFLVSYPMYLNALKKQKFLNLCGDGAFYKEEVDEIKEMLNDGMNPNVSTKQGFTPLMLAGEINHQYRYEIVELLLKKGADVNLKAKYGGYTALLCHNRSDIVKLLLDAGAKVNVKDKLYGFSPLMNTSLFGVFKAVKLLCKNGAKVNEMNDSGRSALFFACCRKNNNDLIALLLDYGADPDLENNLGIMLYGMQNQGWNLILNGRTKNKLNMIR